MKNIFVGILVFALLFAGIVLAKQNVETEKDCVCKCNQGIGPKAMHRHMFVEKMNLSEENTIGELQEKMQEHRQKRLQELGLSEQDSIGELKKQIRQHRLRCR